MGVEEGGGASRQGEGASGGWGEGEEGVGRGERGDPAGGVRVCARVEGEGGRWSESESGAEGGVRKSAWRGEAEGAAENAEAVGCARPGEEGEGVGESGCASWEVLWLAGFPSSPVVEAPLV